MAYRIKEKMRMPSNVIKAAQKHAKAIHAQVSSLKNRKIIEKIKLAIDAQPAITLKFFIDVNSLDSK